MIKESRSVPLDFIDELKTNPMFDNIRGEPEFQKITRELEKKYLEKHEKIKNCSSATSWNPHKCES